MTGTDPQLDRQIVVDAIADVAPDVDPATVEADEDLWYALELDSMDQLRVMTAIGERTGLDIPERDFPGLLTLDDLTAYVTARRAGP